MRDIVAEVVSELARRGVKATHEYPGFVHIARPDGTVFATGTANETWDVQHTTADGSTTIAGSFETNIEVADDNDPKLIADAIKQGLDNAFPHLTVGYLLDVVTRTISVMREQKDDNGEPFAESNAELFDELKAIQKLADEAIGSSHMGIARDICILEGEEHDPHCTCNDCIRAHARSLGDQDVVL